MDTPTDMQAVIDAARQGMQALPIPGTAGAGLYLPNANHGQGEIRSLEGFEAQPYRKRGTFEVFDPASFNQVLRDHAGPGTAIYVDRNPEKPAVEAVLNGHDKGAAGWGDFRCRIVFRPTPQWTKWRAIDGKLIGQTDFAEFVEDNLDDIADPAGARMLEIVTQFQATRAASFRRAIQLSSGEVQFENTENLEAKVGAGHIEVPTTLTLSLAPLFGCPKYAVPARFRWRLTEGKLSLGIKLQRVEDLMRDVLNDVVGAIERSANISVLEGIAPPAVKAG